jgi:hypothetical protein
MSLLLPCSLDASARTCLFPRRTRSLPCTSMPPAIVHALATSPAPAHASSAPEPRTNAGLLPSCARSRSPSSRRHLCRAPASARVRPCAFTRLSRWAPPAARCHAPDPALRTRLLSPALGPSRRLPRLGLLARSHVRGLRSRAAPAPRAWTAAAERPLLRLTHQPACLATRRSCPQAAAPAPSARQPPCALARSAWRLPARACARAWPRPRAAPAASPCSSSVLPACAWATWAACRAPCACAEPCIGGEREGDKGRGEVELCCRWRRK